jgi:hypothetical protein
MAPSSPTTPFTQKIKPETMSLLATSTIRHSAASSYLDCSTNSAQGDISCPLEDPRKSLLSRRYSTKSTMSRACTFSLSRRSTLESVDDDDEVKSLKSVAWGVQSSNTNSSRRAREAIRCERQWREFDPNKLGRGLIAFPPYAFDSSDYQTD